jgi:hypothetical protein
MTAKNMIDKAMIMLGYSSREGNLGAESEIAARGLTFVNLIYADLFYALGEKGFVPLNSTAEDIKLPERVLHDIMPFGVAMYFAQSESDADNQSLYAALYNQKRSTIIRVGRVQDIFNTFGEE